MCRVGITASRNGLSVKQKLMLCEQLETLGATELHHGDCIGGDADAHSIARTMGLYIVGHPPDNDKLRAFCECDLLMQKLPYLERNRDIVNATDILIGMPEGPERTRSGTWSTIRYADKRGKKYLVINA